MTVAAWPWHPNRVLVVDDDRELAELFRHALSTKGGYEVAVAHNLEKAMDVLDLFQPGFVVLDMQLDPLRGDMTSLPLLEKLRHPAQLPVHVIVITGQNQKYPQTQMFQAGGDNYFSKPVDTDILLAYMHRVIEQHTLVHPPPARRIPVPAGMLDVHTMTIYDAQGGMVAVPRRVAQLITLLIQSYPKDVSRQDLVRMLWPNTPDVSDVSLRSLIFRARDLLGSPAAIENSMRDSSWYRWGCLIPGRESPPPDGARE